MYTRKMSSRFVEMFQAREYIDIKVGALDKIPLRIDAIDPKNDNKKVRLLYFDIPKFNVRTAESCVRNSDSKHLIVVYRDSITCFARRVLEIKHGLVTESFPAKELETNITRHVLQPRKFVKLSQEEKKNFIDKWGTNFPKMLETDKIARYFHFVKDDVIEVHRKNGDVIYRIVV